MDVKLLLNDESSSCERPRICRFGPFGPQCAANSAKQHPPHQPQQQRPQLPLPNQTRRTSSYSSDDSSSCSTASHHHHSLSPPLSSAPAHQHNVHLHQRSRQSLAESLPPISSRVPALARSDSGDSDRPHSPITPDTSPGSTPPLRLQLNTQAVPSKASLFIGRSLARPQILSHSSSYSTASSSGPPTSMDSFSANPVHGFLGDMAFPPTPVSAQPYFNPQLPLGGSPDQQHHQQQQQQQPPPPQQNAFAPNNSSASKPGQKKNSYPCPLARQFNCSEYFTTSGHAARHAKKHTGKKDAVCPECSKAFTRKDNMEQHRRTHSKDSSNASRSSSKPQADKDDSRQRKALKLQHQQQQQQKPKSRPSSLSAITSTTAPSPANVNTNQITSPSASSAVTSPSVDFIPTPNSISATAAPPLSLDLTLDPRLREGSTASAPAPAFSPTGFRPPSSFAVAASPPMFNAQFQPGQPQQSFQIPQQHVLPHHQHHRHSSMNMVSTQPMSSPMSSLAAHSPQHHSLPQSPFGNSIDFIAPQQPMGLGMTLPATAGIDLGIPTTLPMMLDETGMPMNPNLSILEVTGELQAPGLAMAPAMDKLALDKLAMAAEAASQGGR